MALRVWLPLNGNLENKGISDYEIRSANITIADDGKIGKCYSFNGSNSYINITNFEIGNNWSYGCWVNTPNSDSRGWEIVMILNNSGSDADSQFAFWVHQKENRFESLANTQYVSTIPYTNYYNNWHHFFATFNGTLLTTYIDGNVVNTKTITATQYNAVNLTIGARSTNAAGTSFASWFQGKLNDIRVYDHCLSPLEVKEISQGLVLHYKLDGFSGGAGENILPNTTSEIRSYEYPSSNFKDQFAVITTKIPEAEKYTLSFYAKSTVAGDKIRAHYYSPNTTTTCVSSQGITKTASDGNMDFTLSTDWQLYWVTYTQTSTTAVKRVILPRMGAVGNTNGVVSGTGIVSIKCVKMEEGERVTSWTPALSEMGIDITKITDSSGYGNDGIITGNVITKENDSKEGRYNISTYIPLGSTDYIITQNPIGNPSDAITMNIWFKSNNTTPGNDYHEIFNHATSSQYFEFAIHKTGYFRQGMVINGTRYVANGGNGLLDGNWHMLTATYDGAWIKSYIDGINIVSMTQTVNGTLNGANGKFMFGHYGPNTGYHTKEACLADARIYATALSAEDILDLYHTPANIDNLGGMHGFEMVEKQGNIFSNVNIAITGALDKNANGVGTYTQANCTVTYENNAIRIYRPPNITHNSSSMHNMWGGMRLRNSSVNSCHEYNENTDNIFGLQKNHTYVIYFTVKGQSSNAATSVGWTNQMGWGGGGLTPNPTNIEYLYTPVNFNGEIQCFYKFTISDDVVKTCTTAYSYATVGKQYLSYNDFMYGFGYESTGSLGTDVYVNNFRMFDITSLDNKNITLNGIVNFLSFNEENDDIAHIHKFGEMQVMNIIEK